MFRIVFISPYYDLSRIVWSIAAELNINVEVYEGSMEQAGKIINDLKEPAVDVYISRRGTAAYIACHTDVPVVDATSGPLDILESCFEARKYSSNIVLISYVPVRGLGLLEKLMGISINNIIVSSVSDVEKSIMALGNNSDCCIVGGSLSIAFARQVGLPGVFLGTSPDSVREALQRAWEIAKLRQEGKKKVYRLKAIMEAVYEGIIAVNENGRIEVFNKAAEQILKLKAKTIIGMNIDAVIPDSRIDKVFKTKLPEIGEVQDIGEIRIIINWIPVLNGHDIIGAVANFQEASDVIIAERKVRKGPSASYFRAKLSLDDIVGVSSAIQTSKRLARTFAASEQTVFIYGPSGTGKDLFAQGIHQASRRSTYPFVAVNCGALPSSLLESELFGYEEGAFTGAKRKGKRGLFELAHGGTIFLDEVDNLPLELQGRLLRVLQEREVLRVGGETIIPVDFRVIAATNTPPRQLLDDKLLRTDLFYRLNVLYLELLALKERKEDILSLCRHFLPEGFLDSAQWFVDIRPFLEEYSWPGNVRELFNFIQRLLVYHGEYEKEDAISMLQVIAPNILEEADEVCRRKSLLKEELAFDERKRIASILKKSGNIKEAAERLGISESTLWRRIKKYNLRNQLLPSHLR